MDYFNAHLTDCLQFVRESKSKIIIATPTLCLPLKFAEELNSWIRKHPDGEIHILYQDTADGYVPNVGVSALAHVFLHRITGIENLILTNVDCAKIFFGKGPGWLIV